jgi:hypothetical protein
MLSNALVLSIKEREAHFLIYLIASLPLEVLLLSKISISGTIIEEVSLKKSMTMSNIANLEKLSLIHHNPLLIYRV